MKGRTTQYWAYPEDEDTKYLVINELMGLMDELGDGDVETISMGRLLITIHQRHREEVEGLLDNMAIEWEEVPW